MRVAPPGCRAKFALDGKVLARTGAVGLTCNDDTGFAMTSDGSTEQDRPWSPAPPETRVERVVRRGHATSHGADPADVEEAPEKGR